MSWAIGNRALITILSDITVKVTDICATDCRMILILSSGIIHFTMVLLEIEVQANILLTPYATGKMRMARCAGKLCTGQGTVKTGL